MPDYEPVCKSVCTLKEIGNSALRRNNLTGLNIPETITNDTHCYKCTPVVR